MMQEDYILREIEKIGQLLQGLLGRFLQERNIPAARPGQSFEDTTEKLKEEMDFDLDQFVTMENAEAKIYLQAQRQLNAFNLELMAELLFQLAPECEGTDRDRLLQKALLSFEMCNERDRTFSIRREQRIAGIRKVLTDAR